MCSETRNLFDVEFEHLAEGIGEKSKRKSVISAVIQPKNRTDGRNGCIQYNVILYVGPYFNDLNHEISVARIQNK
jgi:hypothetical protein